MGILMDYQKRPLKYREVKEPKIGLGLRQRVIMVRVRKEIAQSKQNENKIEK
jgi:hypothetical protein